jgi:NMD protein affecting ribosome stability and mRNA decay
MIKKTCVVCGNELLDKEVDMCEGCMDLSAKNLKTGSKNVRASVRRQNSKERRNNFKKRFKDEE